MPIVDLQAAEATLSQLIDALESGKESAFTIARDDTDE